MDARLGQIRPFTFNDVSRYRPDGPDAMTSHAYHVDFIEARDYGRADSSVRSPAQTDVVLLVREPVRLLEPQSHRPRDWPRPEPVARERRARPFRADPAQRHTKRHVQIS